MLLSPRRLIMASHFPARSLRSARRVLILAAALIFIVPAVAQDKPAAPAAAPEAAKPAEFVGSETCQACHEDIYNAFQKNPHHAVETDKKRGFETKACESCHGPGSKHAESMNAADIRNPAKIAPAETNKTCLTCHLNQPTHIGRLSSSHAKNQVACVSC